MHIIGHPHTTANTRPTVGHAEQTALGSVTGTARQLSAYADDPGHPIVQRAAAAKACAALLSAFVDPSVIDQTVAVLDDPTMTPAAKLDALDALAAPAANQPRHLRVVR